MTNGAMGKFSLSSLLTIRPHFAQIKRLSSCFIEEHETWHIYWLDLVVIEQAYTGKYGWI